PLEAAALSSPNLTHVEANSQVNPPASSSLTQTPATVASKVCEDQHAKNQDQGSEIEGVSTPPEDLL
ncbi:hypothetical protein U1Q18_022751, partial [Sarracenia purpurea var. burkii]